MKSAPFLLGIAFTVTGLGLTATSPAQVLQGGDLIAVEGSGPSVLHITPAGVVTTLHSGPPLMAPTGCAPTRNGEVVICDFTAASLFRIDAMGNLSTLASGVSSAIRMAADINGDFIVTSLTPGQLLRVTPTGTVSVIRSGFSRPFGITVEPDGSYLVTEDTSGLLSHVSRDGSTLTPLGSGLGLAQGVSLFSNGDYAVMVANPDQILRVPRGGGPALTITPSPPLGNPDGIVEDFNGGFFCSESGAPAGNRIVHVDSFGALTVVAGNSAFTPATNLEGMTRILTFLGPATPATGPGASYTLDIRLPAAPFSTYLVVMSATVYPGLPFPGTDPRGTPINPDALFAISIGGLPPFSQNWLGTLDMSGQAAPVLDLSAIAPGLLSGFSLYLQTAAFDPTSPSGVRDLTNLLPLRF